MRFAKGSLCLGFGCLLGMILVSSLSMQAHDTRVAVEALDAQQHLRQEAAKDLIIPLSLTHGGWGFTGGTLAAPRTITFPDPWPVPGTCLFMDAGSNLKHVERCGCSAEGRDE